MQCAVLSYMSATVLMMDGPVGQVQYVRWVLGRSRLDRMASSRFVTKTLVFGLTTKIRLTRGVELVTVISASLGESDNVRDL